VAWTPTGYYSASPGGEDLIGWHVNRGWEQPADFFPASRFRDTFARPDIVERVLDTLDEAEAVRLANDARPGKTAPAPAIAARLPPVVTILAPVTGSRFSTESIDITYEVRSPTGVLVDAIEARIDGIVVQARGVGRIDDPRPDRRSITVPLPRKDAVVTLTARAGALTSVAARLDLVYGGAAPAQRRKPSLYAVVVGVRDYADKNLVLPLARKDAEDFAKGLKTLEGGLYEAVTVKTLIDSQVSRDTVNEQLDWLSRSVTDRDIAVMFLAGHGMLDPNGNYWFLPADGTPDRLRIRGIPFDDLHRSLRGLGSKALLFLDTCHAGRAATDSTARGSVDINKAISEFSDGAASLTIFASSQGREVSQERLEWGNGAFTKAVIEGLFEGRANPKGGIITPLKLQDYIVDRVKGLTDGTQHPTWKPASEVPDFPIAIVQR
jgi:hypothetical protein